MTTAAIASPVARPREARYNKATVISVATPPAPPAGIITIEEPSGEAIQATSQTSIGHKIRTYFQILAKDREYRTGFLAMMTNQFGDGLTTGGSLFLVGTLTAFDPMFTVLGFAIFAIVEIAIASLSYLQAAHQRDNTEQAARANEAQKDRPGRRLCFSGFIDAAAAGILLVGIIGASVTNFGVAATFTLLVANKAVQAFNKSYENGAWNCLKYNLGSESTKKQQLNMRATIGALELGAGGLTYGFIALGTYLTMWGVGIAFPPALPFIGIGTIVVGGLMMTVPKIAFGLWADARKKAEMIADESVANESEV